MTAWEPRFPHPPSDSMPAMDITHGITVKKTRTGRSMWFVPNAEKRCLRTRCSVANVINVLEVFAR